VSCAPHHTPLSTLLYAIRCESNQWRCETTPHCDSQGSVSQAASGSPEGGGKGLCLSSLSIPSLPFSSLLFLPLFVSVYNLAEIVLVRCLRLSTCAFASLSICYLSICLCLYLYVCLTDYLFVCVSTCMFLCLSVCPAVCARLPICQSISMRVCVCLSVSVRTCLYVSLTELSSHSQPATAF
jgi:hypothetical protein